MGNIFIFQLLILGFLIIQIALIIFFRTKQKSGSQEHVLHKFIEYEKRLDKNEVTLRDEFGKNRDENSRSAKDTREELSSTLRINREELLNNLRLSLKDFEEKSSAKIESLTKETKEGLEKNRNIVERKLAEIQEGNEKKLEKMRETVDEKLQKTLEVRLGESFKLVSDRLELVQKGLGEMQSLASDVG